MVKRLNIRVFAGLLASIAVVTLGVLYDEDQHDAELDYRLGICHQAMKQYEQAAEWFRKAIEEAPKRIDSYERLIDLYRGSLQQEEQARRVQADLARVSPTSPQAAVM